jgi:hypothetical protein
MWLNSWPTIFLISGLWLVIGCKNKLLHDWHSATTCMSRLAVSLIANGIEIAKHL